MISAPANFRPWALFSDVDQSLTADGTSADFARYTFPGATPTSVAASNQCFATTGALTGYPLAPPTFIGQIPVPFIFAPANGSTFGAYSPTTLRRHPSCKRAARRMCRRKSAMPRRWTARSTGRLASIISTSIVKPASAWAPIWVRACRARCTTRRVRPTPPASCSTIVSAPMSMPPSARSIGKPVEQFTVGLALRYDIERRRAENLVPFVLDPISGGQINPGQVGGPIPPSASTFKQLQPKITLSYKVNDDYQSVCQLGAWASRPAVSTTRVRPPS